MEAIVDLPPIGALQHELRVTRGGRIAVANERVEPLDAELRKSDDMAYQLALEEGTLVKRKEGPWYALPRVQRSP